GQSCRAGNVPCNYPPRFGFLGARDQPWAGIPLLKNVCPRGRVNANDEAVSRISGFVFFIREVQGDIGMRLLLVSLLLALFMTADTRLGLAQAPVSPPPTAAPPQLGTPPAAQPASGLSLDVCLLEIENLREQQAALQAKPQDDEQKKKIELLQKEEETLEKMVKLLADQLKKQPTGGQPWSNCKARPRPWKLARCRRPGATRNWPVPSTICANRPTRASATDPRCLLP